jgi:hypothetical protein
MTKPNTKKLTTVQINILKISTCGKVTLPDDHTLTYNIGYVFEKTLHQHQRQ